MLRDVIIRPLGYERVDLPLCKVADPPFHIQGDGKSLLIIDYGMIYSSIHAHATLRFLKIFQIPINNLSSQHNPNQKAVIWRQNVWPL